MKLLTKDRNHLIKEKLHLLYEESKRYDHDAIKEQIIDIYEKHLNSEFVITFAGHFSAGKSSMINELLGKNILPKSPIPTSANIVKITSGNDGAYIHLNNGDIVHYEQPYDIDKVRKFCQNKTNVKSVALSTNTNLPEHLVIIDTPGIDAADDRDRQLTEASLHLVDVLFYVMDYNHVQSEVNLSFLQQMKKYNIPLYLIVNQIDKHQSTEISFIDFKTQLKDTFRKWDIKPKDIFFTSLVNFDLPENEYERLRTKISSLGNYQSFSENRSISHLYKAHFENIEQHFDDKLNNMLIDDDLEQAYGDSQMIQQSIVELNEQLTSFKKQYNREIQTTLNNAHIISYETRELAKDFLESIQDGFSVGFFRRKHKTKQAQTKRLTEFYQSIETTIETNIKWRLREKIQQLLGTYQIADQELLQQAQSLRISFSKEDLQNEVHPGATITNRYILNYTKTISNRIKQLFKRASEQFLQLVEQYFKNKIIKEQHEYDGLNKQLKTYETTVKKRQQIKQAKVKELERLQAIFANPVQYSENLVNDHTLDRYVERRQNKIISATEANVDNENSEGAREEIEEISVNKSQNYTTKSKQQNSKNVMHSIDQAIKVIDNVSSLSHIRKDLQNKRHQLDEQQFTIALFGAFSAGKSTFANALIGESILPTSPNPTTATITKIHPVSKKDTHETVYIQFKDESELYNDLLTLLRDFSPVAETVDEFVQWIQTEKILQNKYLNDLSKAYIQAVVSGYNEMARHLGYRRKVTMDKFYNTVADETKACFVQGIDIYYDCAITRKGITLVDTPGADSMYGRHTDISFDYIKHADAIIYVTYYNHAFSRADRTFLTQLGRVKDSFELDKMFFIINAIDLATDEREINLVKSHVQEELQSLGIRLPHIYPVSSKRSLSNQENKYMKHIRQSLEEFIQQDLMDVIFQSIYVDIKRAEQSLQQSIERLALDVQAKERLVKTIRATEKKLCNIISTFDISIYEQRLTERIKRQLYYVQERINIRFHDLFRENFNPTTITTSERQQLRFCLTELIDDTSFELLQELQAVYIRMENKINQLLNEVNETIVKDFKTIDNNFILPTFDNKSLQAMSIERAFQSIDYTTFDQALRIFRNPKSFFERRQSEQMREQIYEQLTPFITGYIEDYEQRMLTHFTKGWQNTFEQFQQFALDRIKDDFKRQRASIEEPLSEKQLINKRDQLQQILKLNEFLNVL